MVVVRAQLVRAGFLAAAQRGVIDWRERNVAGKSVGKASVFGETQLLGGGQGGYLSNGSADMFW
jgi:hypothetical protein